MKFLCDNCKAKYQIPDEKIAGRTLRMKCRKCDHEIVLKGPRDEATASEGSNATKKRPGSSSVGPAPRPAGARRGGSQAGPRPAAPAKRASSLGSEFRKGSLAPDAPAPRAPAAEWYVAINDVPVGPIKRDEVARKIGLGAVTGESLCWREGLDDWKPVAQVPELASLLQQRRVPPPPGSTPPPRASERPPSNVVPIGGRLGAAAAPAFEELEDERTVMAPAPMAEPEPARPAPTPKPAATPKPVGTPRPAVAPKPVAKPAAAPKPVVAPAKPAAAPAPVVAPAPVSAPESEDDPFALPIAPAASAPAPAVAPGFSPAPAPVPVPTPARSGLPVGAWIAIVGAAAFGITLALAIVPKLLDDDPEPVAALEPTPPPEVEPTPTPTPELELEVPEPETTPEPEVTEEAPEAETSAMRSTGTRPVSAMTTTTTSAMTDNLTDEQRRQLELITMSATSGATPSMISLGGAGSGGSTSREALDNDAVRRVVTAQSNQLALRRCYETAIRGMPEAPAVRLDVEVVVGASGTVTRATARGESVGSLTACVEQTVRRWRFPPSSSGGRAQFPVVFSGGGR